MHHVRQFATLLAAPCLAISLAAGGCGLAPDTDIELPDLQGRQVLVAVDESYPPFSDIDPDTGEGFGWDYEMIGEIGRRLNFQPVFERMTWEETLPGISAGQYDMAGHGITITAERYSIVSFSDPYLVVDQRLMVRQGEDRASTLVEFKQNEALLVGAMPGSTNLDAAIGFFGEDRVRTYASIAAATSALLDGEVDGVVVDDFPYQEQAARHPDTITRLPGTLFGNLLAFAFPPESDLTAAVNLAVQAIIADGTFDTITAKWMPDQYRRPSPTEKLHP